jgi:hypothetical protein
MRDDLDGALQLEASIGRTAGPRHRSPQARRGRRSAATHDECAARAVDVSECASDHDARGGFVECPRVLVAARLAEMPRRRRRGVGARA